ncbi:MAG: hypothetical protein IPP94_18600 [Ignavibacteria bacterium]|nr:hypothetical protein [Ignavibacteria bacterium]
MTAVLEALIVRVLSPGVAAASEGASEDRTFPGFFIFRLGASRLEFLLQKLRILA